MNERLGPLEAHLIISRLSRERTLRRLRLREFKVQRRRVRRPLAGLLHAVATRLDPVPSRVGRPTRLIRMNEEQPNGQA